MTPIEILRGRTPEDLAQKFNAIEAKGWKPIPPVGCEGGSLFMAVYRPPNNLTEEQGLQSETNIISQKKLAQVHQKLREIYPVGKPTRTISDRDAFTKYSAGKDQEVNIAFLFPHVTNMPMAKLFHSLVRRGFGTVESLLSFPEDEWVRGFGKKNLEEVKAIKKILLSQD